MRKVSCLSGVWHFRQSWGTFTEALTAAGYLRPGRVSRKGMQDNPIRKS
jgi:hypothetical protein